MALNRAVEPKLDLPADFSFVPGGWVGERLEAMIRNWLVPAPVVNEGMVAMFADRTSSELTNKDVPWEGEFAGKYLVGAVQALRMSDDPALGFTVGNVVKRLVAIQRGEVAAGRDASLSVPLNWELWGQYHVVLGLLAWHRYSGDPDALLACQAAADQTCATYLNRAAEIAGKYKEDDEKNHAVAHVLALLHEVTGTQQYLDLARQIEAEWKSDRCFNPVPGTTDFAPVRCGNFVENALGGQEFSLGTRNRWESLHDVQAIAELHLITGDTDLWIALTQIWRSLLRSDVNPSGGIGAGERMVGNRFDPHYVETCATVAWMALSVDVLRLTEDPRVADQLELSLFNAVLGAGSPDGRHWTYHTPVGGQAIENTWAFPNATPEAVRVGYRLPAVFDLWWQGMTRYPQLSCCAANGPRGIGCLADWAVLRSTDAVTVNYYGPGTSRFTDPRAGDIRIVQETDYPIGDTVTLRVLPLSGAADLTVQLRIPEWSATTRLTVNGEEAPTKAGTYCRISRRWVPTDVVVLHLDFTVRREVGSREAAGLAVYHRGPLLLAADARFGWQPPDLPTVESVGRFRDRLDLDPPVDVAAVLASVLGQDDGRAEARISDAVSAALGDVGVDATERRPGTPTKVLVTARTSDGPMLLCDFASAGQSPSGALPDRPDTDGTWCFARYAGSIIAPRLTLRPDGSIGGHSHPNESRWGFDGDILTFFGADGAPTTRFASRLMRNGLQVLMGTFLPDVHVRHLLSQLSPGLEKPWLFSRADGTVLRRRVRFLTGGGFDVRMEPNESRWGQVGDAPAFFGPDGEATTVFDQVEVHNGRMRYRGAFLPDPRVTHVLDELPADLTGSLWLFDRVPRLRSPIADKLRLLPGGRIDGHVHPNETSWRVREDILEFLGPAGVPTTRFETITVDPGGIHLTGKLLDDSGIVHALHERAAGWELGGDYAAWLPLEK